MQATGKSIKLRVWGDYACFTRPEMKAERVSYDVMTPSAARNILQAIMWKPAMDWIVERIEVIRPVKWVSIRRNEVGSVVPAELVKRCMTGSQQVLAMYIEEERQQRAGLFLQDVEYVVTARPTLTKRKGEGDNLNKFYESFVRRASKGQCFMQPYLGCREFAAYFQLIEDGSRVPTPVQETRNLGWMLHDMDFSDMSAPRPRFFNANMVSGVVHVPPSTSKEVRG